ncbi:MAG: Gfo/Idh/MocA family oxidoreductase [Eubacteriales bacterium]|nr:Gfo/Idh/MocA family oxidoreductase [Eubacteriales bacterium]MDD3882070.1 Gfo/Idh/MocA family oxidoreductase [Eubacteriales bacterium]MDD4512517.1 Gfo/Idh/MocA family oxidoreductase [Eubacteriales bacterium]
MSDAVLGQFEQMTVKSEGTYPRKARVGIIGAGWIAESHVESYLRMPDVEIVAVADLIDGKAKAFCERFGIKGANLYNSHKELLASEKLDAVSVCTYNRTHAECAIDALKAGVNVLLEKPMCVTLEEGIEIMRAEKESGKVLSIGFQPRFDKNMQKVKEIVDSGMLGEIYYIQTGGGRRRGIPNSTFIEQKTAGIGAIGDIGCYALDLVLNAIGYPKPLTASGYTSAFFGTNTDYSKPENACRFNVDDFAAAFVRLDGGIILDFRIAWAMHIDSPCDTIILGKKGGLRIPATECWNGTMSAPMTFYTDMAGSFTETKIPLIPNSEGKGLFYQKIRSFLDAVMYGGKAPIPTSQAIYNQAIIDGIVRSAKLGREVEINVPEV